MGRTVSRARRNMAAAAGAGSGRQQHAAAARGCREPGRPTACRPGRAPRHVISVRTPGEEGHEGGACEG